MTYDRFVKIVKFIMGGLAAVAVFLLIQPDGTLPDPIPLILGAYLAFAAYVDPQAVAGGLRPGLKNANGASVLILSVILASSALFLAPAVLASGNDSSSIRWWEDYRTDPFGNPEYGGDTWVHRKVDTGSIANLNNIDFNLWLGCDNAQNDWNNCISGITYNVVSGSCVRFYDGTNFTTPLFTIFGPKTGSPLLLYRNQISSIRWGDTNSSGGCSFGAYD